MKGEIWKPVRNYEGLYEVSNLGRVKSLNYRRTGKERILKAGTFKNGYLYINLCKDGKMKHYTIHRLVATTFLENTKGYTEVNHKDENKQNNCVENLEFCSRSYNNTYNGRAKKVAEKNNKPVFSVNKESGLIMYWNSIKEASRVLGIAIQSISNCLKGRSKSAGGFYWIYDDDNE